MQQRVQKRGAVTCAENKAVAVEKGRVLGVVDEVVRKQRVPYRRATERKSRVTAVSLVNRFRR